jgi:D-xylulose reductase
VPSFDVAIEATGAELCIQMAIHALRLGGFFVQTGLGNPNVNFPITVVSMSEITVKGCFRYGPGDYKMALELALMGKINLRSLITKVLPFEKVTDAWETTRRGEGIKTLIQGVDFSDE